MSGRSGGLSDTLCACGCGERTRMNTTAGAPRAWVGRHHARKDAQAAFWAKVEKTATCWLWTAQIGTDGYGHFYRWRETPRFRLAHRFAYELLVGPIPADLTLDHLCRVRACVNPAHLEPVTLVENIRRGYAARRVVTS